MTVENIAMLDDSSIFHFRDSEWKKKKKPTYSRFIHSS